MLTRALALCLLLTALATSGCIRHRHTLRHGGPGPGCCADACCASPAPPPFVPYP